MMDAIEFVKLYGVSHAKYVLRASVTGTPITHGGLKQIVDAFDLVESFGGLDGFKDEYMSRIENNECVSWMDKVIELVEKCNES